MSKNVVKTSKFLSMVLRHKPETIGLTLDEQGWANVDELITRMQKTGKPVSRKLLEEVVATNDKKRFAFSADGRRIRANQGHSIQIDLELKPADPPAVLYHGTATRNLGSIYEKGLLKGERHHVHLSDNRTTAHKVGQRYGKPIILLVNTASMVAAGHTFYVSENGVWLTEHVPPQFLKEENNG